MSEASHETKTTPPAAEKKAPPMQAPVVEAKPRKPREPLNEMRFTGLEFKQTAWMAIVEAGTTLEDLLRREYWANNAAKLRRLSKIVVCTEDSKLYVELIVFAVGSNWAEVRVLGTPIVVTSAISRAGIADDYRIEDGGLHKDWQIVRISDGRVVKGDGTLKTEDAARAWLREYLAAQGLRPAA